MASEKKLREDRRGDQRGSQREDGSDDRRANPCANPQPSRDVSRWPGPAVVSREFFKAHAHGNDYLVVREGQDLPLSPNVIGRICDRWKGLGADGIVVVGEASQLGGQIPLRMFNPDGSEFERSGNGLRIAAAFLHEVGQVGLDPFLVTVGGDVVELQILGVGDGGVLDVMADMGQVTFPDGPPFLAKEPVLSGRLVEISVASPEGGPETLHGLCVSVGNPHCVLFRSSWSEEELEWYGPQVTAHPVFPEGTNVQFASTTRGQTLPILIWERGVGRTSSSGTSACAAASAAVRQGYLASGEVLVAMEGGNFEISVSPEFQVRLRGPVESLYTARLADGMI